VSDLRNLLLTRSPETGILKISSKLPSASDDGSSGKSIYLFGLTSFASSATGIATSGGASSL
jgi:hypothetical protein